jgi:WD40 repeat protein
MAERDRFELDLAAALRAYAEEAPTHARPTELARHFATAYPRGGVTIGWRNVRLGPAIAWALLLVGMLAALIVGGLVAGAWRTDRAIVVVPTQTAVPARAPSWTITGSTVTIHDPTTATLLRDGRVLVTGGNEGAAELYDPGTGTWTAAGSMVTPRVLFMPGFYQAVLLADGRVLVAGGHAGPYSRAIASAELYDPASGTWTATAKMSTPRTEYSATLLPSGKVLVAGGQAQGVGPMASAELYDPVSGTWSRTGSMTMPRVGHAAALLPDGRVLVAGGQNQGPDYWTMLLSSAELYDPASGTWTVTGSMATSRQGSFPAILLADGRVLVTGGNGESTAELYDPRSGTWISTGSRLTTADRTPITTVLLSNGTVLAVGGGSNANTVEGMSSFELYDPTSGTWAATARMPRPLLNPIAARLADGRVLVVGYWDPVYRVNTVWASAELYDPGAGK